MSLKKRYASLIFSLILILVFFSAVSVATAGDFTASSNHGRITLCRGDMYQDTVTVTSTDQAPGAFSVSPSENWAQVVPQGFILGPAGAQDVVDFIRPPLQAGTYELRTTISSGTVTKVLTQTIEVRDCENTKVQVFQQEATICPCTPALYIFNITNTGTFTDTYDLGIDAEPTFYTLSENPVVVRPGRSRAVYAYFNFPCSQYGRASMHFITEARLSGERTETGFNIDISRGCYDYSLDAGDALNLSTNKTSAKFVPSANAKYSLCYGTDYEIPVRVRNTANVSNIFRLSSDLTIDGNKMEMPSGTTAYTYVLVQGMEPGFYNRMINSVSLRGNIVKSLPLAINISPCGNASLLQGPSAQFSGLRIALFVLLAVLIVLIVLFALIFPRAKRWLWKREQKRLADEGLQGRARKFLAVHKRPVTAVIVILLLVLVTIASYYLLRNLGIDMVGLEWGILGSMFAFASQHMLYVILDIVLLAIIIACILWLPKLLAMMQRRWKEKRERADIVLEKYPKERSSSMWMFVVVIVVVVFFLLSSLCFFTTVCKNAGLNIEITHPANTTNQTQLNETAGYIVENSTVYIWNKNTVKEIDLSRYIINQDNVTLQYIFTPVENMTVQISDQGIVTLTPDRGWFGHRVMNFIIDDGRGNRVISPDIDLYVLDVNRTFADRLTDFLAVYVNYIIIGLLFIVIVVILLILFTKKPGRKKRILVRRKGRDS